MEHIYKIQAELNKIEVMRKDLQKNVLDVNQSAIYENTNYHEREELFKSHDAIIDFINNQTVVINLCIFYLQNMHTSNYVDHLQQTITDLKKYIRVLGGNPSIVSYTKKND